METNSITPEEQEKKMLRESVQKNFCMNCVGALENKCPALQDTEILDKQIIVEEDSSYTCSSYQPVGFTFNEDQIETEEQRELFVKYDIEFGKAYTIKEVMPLFLELEALAKREENPTILSPHEQPAE